MSVMAHGGREGKGKTKSAQERNTICMVTSRNLDLHGDVKILSQDEHLRTPERFVALSESWKLFGSSVLGLTPCHLSDRNIGVRTKFPPHCGTFMFLKQPIRNFYSAKLFG